MVKLIFECGGCFEKAEGMIARRFESFTGRLGGFGVYVTDKVEDAAPEGWVVFDPYTSCTYCPKCWQEIENEEEVA